MELKEIRTLVQNYYRVDLNDKSRLKNNVDAKRMYFYIAIKIYKHKVTVAGHSIGLRHDTAIYHRDKGIDFVKYGYTNFIDDVFNITGKDLTKDRRKQRLETLGKLINLNDLPIDKLNELSERINLMIKGYNFKHGKDEHEIINCSSNVSEYIS